MTTASKAAKAPNYTPAQEQAIRDAAPLNNDKAIALAAQMGKTAASVRAKAVRMGVAYDRKVAVTKSGGKVEKKETLVAEIAALVSGNLDGLDKAPKLALQALRDHLLASGE
jgi:hypothetical protein